MIALAQLSVLKWSPKSSTTLSQKLFSRLNFVFKVPILYIQMVKRIASRSWNFLAYNPYCIRTRKFIWKNLLLILACLSFLEYYRSYRNHYLIKRHNCLADVDLKIRDMAANGLSDGVLRDQNMVDVLADFLYRLVTQDQETKDLMTRLLI